MGTLGMMITFGDVMNLVESVQAGDCILSVNGTKGSAAMEVIQKESELEITFQKMIEVTHTITKTGTLGLNLTYQDARDFLVATEIFDGAVKTYNASVDADKQFRIPARILAVDGVRGNATAMVDKLKTASESMQLIVSQPVL